MANFSQLIESNTYAANIAADPNTAFNKDLGQFVLRNTVCVLDKLEPLQFDALSEESKDLIYDTVRLAKDIAPMAAEELSIYPNENSLDYAYRINIRQPLGTLQAKLNGANYQPQTPEEVAKIKKALHVGAAAFAAVVYESIDRPAILEAEDFFWDNTTAAVRRADRLVQ